MSASQAVPLVIAIDGPSGSGKSTVARAVATRVGLEFLDTGAMYRSVTLAAMQAGLDVDDAAAVEQVAKSISIDVSATGVTVDGVDVTEEIRSPLITSHVSAVAVHAGVRDEMRHHQRAWAEQRGGGVMEGRDIGSVIFPDAPLKVYLTATVEERARRRAAQTGQDAADVAADMHRRDGADSTRTHSPLAQASDAVVIDSTNLSLTEVVEVIATLVRLRGSESESCTTPVS